MSTELENKDLASNDAKPKLYDGQKVLANWDGKLGTVRKLYRKPYAFNKSYQYYIDWDNGHWGFASENELSPVV